MSDEKIKIPQLSMRADFNSGSVDTEKRTAKLMWGVGAKVLRSNFLDGSWFEQLSMDPSHIRMDRLKSGNMPLLNSHGQSDLADVIGVVEQATVSNGQGEAVVRFSKRAEVEPIFQDVLDQIIRNVSVGYRVYKFERQPQAEGEDVPTFLATDWEPCEISLVPVGADPSAVLARAEDAQSSECIIVNRIAERGEEEKTMAGNIKETPAVQSAAPTIEMDSIKRETIALERKRVSEIQDCVRKAKLSSEFGEKLIAEGVEIDAARAAVINEIARIDSEKPATRNTVRIEAGEQDERLTLREGMTDALLHRSMPHQFEVTEKGKQYRSMSLLRLAEEIVGPSARLMSRSALASRAMASSDFPIILNNTARKMLRAQYEVQPQTFKVWAQAGTLPDYKEMDVDQLGSFSSLEKIPEGAEYKFGVIGEGREKIKVAKYGKILAITEEIIVNDDLNAMSRSVIALGRAAARVESKIVYTDILLANPTMSDTVALFHADHGNLPAAATITNGYSAARAAMRAQKDLDGNDYLDLEPGFLIVGPDKEEEALKMLNGQIVAAKIADANVWRNSAQPIVESRISGNKWFLAAKNYDTVMYAYLDGMNGPEISEHAEYKSDVINIKVKHVFGAKAIDYRGLVYNSGL